MIIAGNWKMHKTIGEALELVAALKQKLEKLNQETLAAVTVIVAPPYTAINALAKELAPAANIKIAAQDLFWEKAGAFTGAISASMLKEAGAQYVIIGHSERRTIFNDTNKAVNSKIKAALKEGLTPIFCVGETLPERESRGAIATVTEQLNLGLEGLSAEEAAKIVIAYEPVWAIGTGKTASPSDAEEVHLAIRQLLTSKFNASTACAISLIYGGSVKPSNARELLSQPNLDGALVGGASLNSEDFVGIIEGAFVA